MKAMNEQILTASPMNVNIASAAIDVRFNFGYALQAVYTGSTISGTLKLQGSCDPATGYSPIGGPTNWTDISNSSVVISAAGSQLYNVTDVMYNWVRLVYTDASSGTSDGVLTAIINVKGI